MVKSEAQRQKKIAKQHAKDRQQKLLATRQKQQLQSMQGVATLSVSTPIHDCCITVDDGLTQGMRTIHIARRMAGGKIAHGFFLVDLFCLGIKDAGARLLLPSQYTELKERMERELALEPIQPGSAKAIIEGAIQYARDCGFDPHPDYRKCAPIFSDIETGSLPSSIQFGDNGKPHFIMGPHDDHTRCRGIATVLANRFEPGQYELTAIVEPGQVDQFGNLPFPNDDDMVANS